MELADLFALLNAALGEERDRVDGGIRVTQDKGVSVVVYTRDPDELKGIFQIFANLAKICRGLPKRVNLPKMEDV